jgi:hypothetical protein
MSEMDPVITLESAQSILRSALEPIAGVRVGQAHRNQPQVDFVLDVTVGRKPWQIHVIVKDNGQPRHVRAAALQLRAAAAAAHAAYGVVLVPYASDRSLAIGQELGVGVIDLAGNRLLHLGAIYVQTTGQPNRFQRDFRAKSIFSPKASRLLRVLLTWPQRRWGLQEVAKEAGISLGHASSVKQALQDQEYVRHADDGIVLEQPLDLLAAWKDHYELKRHAVLRFFGYQPIEQIEAALGSAARRLGLRCALTGYSASALLAPMTKHKRVTAYAAPVGDDSSGGAPRPASARLADLADELHLRPVDSGDTVMLMIPHDQGVFYHCDESRPTPVVSPIQAYLDLIHLRARGEEAAEHLLETVIKPTWQ